MIPELSSHIKHAVTYPAGMHVVNPYSITTTIFDRFVSDGGEFTKQRIEAIEPTDTFVKTISEARVMRQFHAVAVSAGHLSGRLLKLLGYKVPIIAERGYHLEMSHQKTSLNMPVGAYERGFHITHHHLGLTLAPITAIIMSELMTGVTPSIDIEAFNLRRFN